MWKNMECDKDGNWQEIECYLIISVAKDKIWNRWNVTTYALWQNIKCDKRGSVRTEDMAKEMKCDGLSKIY